MVHAPHRSVFLNPICIRGPSEGSKEGHDEEDVARVKYGRVNLYLKGFQLLGAFFATRSEHYDDRSLNRSVDYFDAVRNLPLMVAGAG